MRCVLLIVLLAGPGFLRAADLPTIDEGFEGELPEFHTYRAAYAADTAQAHTGAKSLRVEPQDSPTGGAYFRLEGAIDLTRDYEFSAWVRVQQDNAASLYISAAGEQGRYTVARTGGGTTGTWVKLVGHVRKSQWKGAESQPMLAMVTTGSSWFDDVVLRAVSLPDPPIEQWPELEARLRAAADERALALHPGARLEMDATAGVLVADIAVLEVTVPKEPHTTIGPDGVLLFAVDTAEPTYVTGTLTLTHAEDLRPGLRAYVLCDSTLVAAPMVAASAWQGVDGKMTAAAPDIRGTPPPQQVELVTWFLPEGRHYLMVAGPQFRSAGVFRGLSLRSLERDVAAVQYRFALFSDTHVGSGRSNWMNAKLSGPGTPELTRTLSRLRDEDTQFAIIAGDMTDGATREQFTRLAEVLRDSRLQVYGCVGNHDAYHETSRRDQLELLPDAFPGGRTQYVLDRPPLRFVVLDASYWRTPEGGFVEKYERGKTGGIGMKPEQFEWLRQTLSSDKRTPTIVVSHYPFRNHGGASSCGYELAPRRDAKIMDLLCATPNVVATLNGHTHWNSVDDDEGVSCIQNAAFVEWPNMYRVFRVYDDRIEWDVRLASNFGFVRESFVPTKALSWMISTADGDLAGVVRLANRQ